MIYVFFKFFKDQLSKFEIDSLQNAKHIKRVLKLQWSDIVSEDFFRQISTK
jgi:hypothetical protein